MRVGVTLLTLLVAGSARAGAREFQWPKWKAMELLNADAPMRADGVPVQISAVRVAGKPQDFVQRYVDAFRDAGLFVPLGSAQPAVSQIPMLTAIDPSHRISFTVLFQDNGDGSTTLIQGEAHLAKRVAPATGLLSTLVPPGAQEQLTTALEGAELLTYRVIAKPDVISAFTAHALKGAGYRADAQAAGVFQRGSDEVQLQMHADGLVQRVVLSHRRSEAPVTEPTPKSAPALTKTLVP